MKTIFLLIASNVFMTMAWYGHLRFRSSPLWAAILVSWGIAFFEYCLQVPANRWGYMESHFSAAQLKTLQEVITLAVFSGFSILWLGETPSGRQFAGFALIALGAGLVFKK